MQKIIIAFVFWRVVFVYKGKEIIIFLKNARTFESFVDIYMTENLVC